MQTHQIHQMAIEVQATDRQAATTRQQQLHYWAQTDSFERMLEGILSEVASEDEYLYLDLVELNLKVEIADERGFQTSFLRALRHELHQARSPQPFSGSTFSKLNPEQTVAEAVLYFLRTGSLPWYVDPVIKKQVQLRIKALPYEAEEPLWQAILSGGQEQPVVWKRLLWILNDEEIVHWLERLPQVTLELVEKIRKLPEVFFTSWQSISAEQRAIPFQAEEVRLRMWLEVLRLVTARKSPAQWLPTIERSLRKQFAVKELPLSEHRKRRPEKLPEKVIKAERSKIEEAGLMVEQAGLVLLWGLYGRLFRQLGWVEKSQFIDEDARKKAILLLYYLATGEEEAWEFDLLIPKLLCGWDLGEPLDVRSTLPAADYVAADDLLREFLTNWMPHKSFSPDWLRANFLQREGSLTERPDGHWQLAIEQKTEDVLLKKLPPGVGYSLIKYAWMDHILFVEW